MVRPTLLLILCATLRLSAAQKSPNIVIILADDFGYGSANCYGADVKHIRTPNIDRLAREGIRFTHAYTPGSVCTPTRYALLTGRYAWRWILRTVKEEPEKPFFLYFAPVAVHHPISPSDKLRGTSGVGPYGDFIHDLDHSVGEVVDALAYAGVLDDTIVIFTSDNGGDSCPEE